MPKDRTKLFEPEYKWETKKKSVKQLRPATHLKNLNFVQKSAEVAEILRIGSEKRFMSHVHSKRKLSGIVDSPNMSRITP